MNNQTSSKIRYENKKDKPGVTAAAGQVVTAASLIAIVVANAVVRILGFLEEGKT